MNLDNGARVRHPRDPIESRLGTITDITYAPYSTYIKRARLRFPNGEERTYQAGAVYACSRTDDHAALVAALTGTLGALLEACRIAQDYDERLSADLARLVLTVHNAVASRLGANIDAASLGTPPAPHAGKAAPSPSIGRADQTGERS